MPADQSLARYAETGDDDAFRDLAERHSGVVYSCAVQQTGSPEAAEEIVQNVFVTLAKNAVRIKSHPALSGWLYKAARNETANYLRRESKRGRKMKDYQAHQRRQAEAHEG